MQKILIRRADERGHFDHGWLKTWHTFSFADYHDENFMGFRALRVINEDRVAPGEGFPTHGHRDMEIITYVIDGAIAHKDSMGTSSTILPGEVQRMTAGSGVRHSEFNALKDKELHLLQIWILPAEQGLKPGYEQKKFPMEERKGNLRLVASQDGHAGSVTVHQDVKIYAGVLDPGQSIEDRLEDNRHAWIQVARGVLNFNGQVLSPGDGAAVMGGGVLDFRAPLEGSQAEFLLFDLG